jgi:hypothetical protein
MAYKNIFSKLNIDPNSLSEKDVLFISGAGISAASPTQFALGDELHKVILKTFSKLNDEEIINYLTKKIALEETCQVIIDHFEEIDNNLENGGNIGWHILSELFSFNNFSTRNDYHFYFRNHIINGGRHITANIDQLIETNFPESGKYFDVITTNTIEELYYSIEKKDYSQGLLYKFHGDINSDHVGAQGFLKSIIENGFGEKTQSFWKNLINDTSLVIFVGYGGVDKFDVKPLFKSWKNREFAKTKAIWIDYGENLEIEVQNTNAISELYLSPFSSSVSIKCSPDVILNQLFDRRYKIITAHRTPNNLHTHLRRFLEKNVCKLIDDNNLLYLSKNFLSKK